MDKQELKRCEILGRYIVDTGATVRDAASKYGISKSTVHKDVTDRLKRCNRSLYELVRIVLDTNKSERHLRGGAATKNKYEEKQQGREVYIKSCRAR